MFLTGIYTNSSRIYISQMIFCCDSFILSKIHMYTYTMTAILNFKTYRNFLVKKGTSLLIQWLEPGASAAGNPVLIASWGAKIPQATQCAQIIEKESVWECVVLCGKIHLSRPHSSEVLISEILDKVQKTEFCWWPQKHCFNERKLESFFLKTYLIGEPILYSVV